MKKIIAIIAFCAIIVCGTTVYAGQVHTHAWSHNFDGTTYQEQIRTYSKVYEWLDGVPVYRPYVEYGLYNNCTLKCGCGQEKRCNSKHLVRTLGGWAY